MGLLCATAAKALQAPVEVTLRQLLDEYELDSGEGLLPSLVKLNGHLSEFHVTCEPPIGHGDLDEIRVLAIESVDPLEAVLKEIREKETAVVEFKSSLYLDVRRFRQEPGEALSAYKLEGVTRSAMKTIAAFANTGGGTLYIGVEDEGVICGLAEDFELANPKRRDYDGWDQALRGQIEASFYDGRTVANYVKATCLAHEGKSFVRLQIGARTALTFLKKVGGGAELYVRSGTRSIPIEYQEIEKHYDLKRLF